MAFTPGAGIQGVVYVQSGGVAPSGSNFGDPIRVFNVQSRGLSTGNGEDMYEKLYSFCYINGPITGTEATLYFPPGDYGFSANFQFQSNFRVWMAKGARFKALNAGRTLTFSGDVDFPLDQVFDLSLNTFGVVISRRIRAVYPQWWGAKGDKINDDTSAIEAADTTATSGAVALTGGGRGAKTCVFFSPGNYKHTGLNYRAAPWRSSGLNTVTLFHYTSRSLSLNAIGTSGDRILLDIEGIIFDGSNAAATVAGVGTVSCAAGAATFSTSQAGVISNGSRLAVAGLNYTVSGFNGTTLCTLSGAPTFGASAFTVSGADCLGLGFNMRSLHALRKVRIVNYSGRAFYFAADNWILSFYDVYCAYNAGGVFAKDAASAFQVDFNWFNLVAEVNGSIGSGIGGIELNSPAFYHWNFFGGDWEDNLGAAEARFIDCNGVNLFGTYIEAAVGEVTDGVVFGGATLACLHGMNCAAASGVTGKGIVVQGSARVTLDNPYMNAGGWPTFLSIENTAIVTLLSEGTLDAGPISVADGASFIRLQPKTAELVDAAAITLDASEGTFFHVSLAGNRAMAQPTNASDGQVITIQIQQDAVGGRTLTWNGFFKLVWSDVGNAAALRSSVSFRYYGARWWQVGTQTPYTG